MPLTEPPSAVAGGMDEEEWSVGVSDDELLACQLDTGMPYFEPKDPEEIVRLYAVMADKGVINLEWVSPGRMEAKRENEDADEKHDAKETAIKSELNEFDFDEPTPTVSLTSFRKQKKNPQGGQRKVASFDKIMNDITKGKSSGPAASSNVKKESPTKEKKQRKPKQSKASKGALAATTSVNKTNPDKVTITTSGSNNSILSGTAVLQSQIKQEQPGTPSASVTPGTPTTPTGQSNAPTAPINPSSIPTKQTQPQQQITGLGQGMRTGTGPIMGGLMGPQQHLQTQGQQHIQAVHVQQQGPQGGQQQAVSQGMMAISTTTQPMQQQSNLQQAQQQQTQMTSNVGGQQQQHPNLLKQMLVPGVQQGPDGNNSGPNQSGGLGVAVPPQMAMQIQPGQTSQSIPIVQQMGGVAGAMQQQAHQQQQLSTGQQMSSGINQTTAGGMQGIQPQTQQQQIMAGQQTQQQVMVQQGPLQQQQSNAGQQSLMQQGMMIQTVQGVQHKMNQMQLAATGQPQQQQQAQPQPGQYNVLQPQQQNQQQAFQQQQMGEKDSKDIDGDEECGGKRKKNKKKKHKKKDKSKRENDSKSQATALSSRPKDSRRSAISIEN